LPPVAGFYAWWVKRSTLPRIPRTPHPSKRWDLFYVGIAPGRPGSAANLASRVAGQHIGGNTGSSTFRFSLASLLFEEKNWQPIRRGAKVVLSAEDNMALREWQMKHAGLRWAPVADPWREGLERSVIAAMKPPLNLAENASHPFHAEMASARRRFRAAVDEAPPSVRT
jgi:hypothetical protein